MSSLCRQLLCECAGKHATTFVDKCNQQHHNVKCNQHYRATALSQQRLAGKMQATRNACTRCITATVREPSQRSGSPWLAASGSACHACPGGHTCPVPAAMLLVAVPCGPGAPGGWPGAHCPTPPAADSVMTPPAVTTQLTHTTLSHCSAGR